MRPQRAAGKGRIFHDDLHAFSSGGILFVNNGALRKERVSDGPLFRLLAKSMKKCRQKPMASAGVLWRLSFAIERKLPVGDKIRLLPQRYAAGGNKISNCKNIPRRRPKQHKNTPPRRMTQPGRQREGKRAHFKRRRVLSRPHASGSPHPPP